MGDVYRAHDERLSRDVALKVLPTGLTDDRERLERFAQEAKSASALNHPNIVVIYEIGRARPSFVVEELAGQRQRPDEVHYIAMELVEGETLRDFLFAQPSLTRRLEVLAQTADGLGKAHAAGIVHRDLKPDNVMVSLEGYAKVVDFGLAKLVEPANGWNPLGADSPTMKAITAQGELIGTAGYMSPEQILGKVIDQRSDIFSFGCIIYEAVTGRRPFDGDSFVDTLHQVLHATPAPIEHAELQRIVGKCLVKDREYRYQSIRDVALDLRAAEELRAPEAPAVKARKTTPLLAGIAIIAIAAFIAWQVHLRMRAANVSTGRSVLQRITSNGHVGHLAVSPDGRFAAYTVADDEKGEGVWLQQLATGSRVNVIPHAPKLFYAGLAFSADGNHLIATRYEGTIYGSVLEVPILGGTLSKLIGDADTAATPSPDGTRLAVTRDVLEKGESRLLVTARDGSHGRVLATLSMPDGAASPAWSPDGKQLAVAHGQNVFAIDAVSGARRPIAIGAPHGAIHNVAWSAAGDALLISAIDERSAGRYQLMRVEAASGTAISLTDDYDDYTEPRPAGASVAAIQTKYQSTLWSITPGTAPGSPATQLTRGLGTSDGLYGLTSARDRRIIYSSSAGGTVDLWAANADGSDARQLTNDARLESHPVVTSDGSTIVYISRAHGTTTIWRMNIDGAQPRQIAVAPAIYDFALSPDGKRIVYASGDDTSTHASLTTISIDGGAASKIATTGPLLKGLSVTPDGRTVVFSALDDKALKVFKVAIGGGQVTKLFDSTGNAASISPDGKLIAFAAGMEDTGAKLTVMPIDGGAPLPVPAVPGRMFRWTPDGKGIAYIRRDGKQENIFIQPLADGPSKALTAFPEGSIANYEWSPDGQRIVLTHYLQMCDVVLLNPAGR